MALRQNVGELACTLMSLVRTRLELFALEASDQKSHLVSLLGFAFGALLFLTLAVLVSSITIALYFWPTDQRYLALALLAFFYALVGVWMFLVVRNKLVSGPAPFAATIDELRRDVMLVERLREPDGKSATGDSE